MKIILDMNIPEIWVKFLNDAGHEVIHWNDIGDIRADDSEIMGWRGIINTLCLRMT